MVVLTAGVVLFSAVHLIPSLAPGARAAIVARIGENPYRGLFALLILAGIALMVTGWQSAAPAVLYSPPMRPGVPVGAIVLVAFVLFVAAQAQTSIKRFVRHPQLTGIILWGIAHLLTNGDTRSVVLFGGLTAWAGLEILLCNRRDGAWQRPPVAAARADVGVVLIATLAFAVIAYLHRWLFGVSVGHGFPSL